LSLAADPSIEPLLDDVRGIVRRDAPYLERLLEIFSQEARVGREWLAPSLNRLAPGAAILEVGAGLMLLSCQLAKEGFRVAALEPVGEGFSSFSELQKLVLAYAEKQRIAPGVLPIPVERLDQEGKYDLAYSINVMEHVGNVWRAPFVPGASTASCARIPCSPMSRISISRSCFQNRSPKKCFGGASTAIPASAMPLASGSR
jgi:hypothetical protein